MNCGTSLSGTAGGATPATAGTPGSPQPYPSAYPGPVAGAPWDTERQKQIGRTSAGVLILLFGALISWIPYVGGFGVILTLIGAILVILGRKAFGKAHRRMVSISIVVFLLGVAIFISGIFLAVGAAIGGLTSSQPEPQLAATLLTLITNIVISVVLGLLVIGIASVFFTYALQKREGKLILLGAYGATVVIRMAIVLVTLPLLPPIAAEIAHEIATTGTVDPSRISSSASNVAPGLELLTVIPALLYVAANYLVWARIKKGEIPAPEAMPPAPPATMGSNPPTPPTNPM